MVLRLRLKVDTAAAVMNEAEAPSGSLCFAITYLLRSCRCGIATTKLPSVPNKAAYHLA